MESNYERTPANMLERRIKPQTKHTQIQTDEHIISTSHVHKFLNLTLGFANPTKQPSVAEYCYDRVGFIVGS